MELQESPKHLGIYNETSREVMLLLTGMLRKEWDGFHSCVTEQLRVNCVFCQNIALWHQLASQLMEHICPRDPLKLPSKDLPKVDDIKHQTIRETPGVCEDVVNTLLKTSFTKCFVWTWLWWRVLNMEYIYVLIFFECISYNIFDIH